jgi:uncharacterized protein YigE (DUF2233 family)
LRPLLLLPCLVALPAAGAVQASPGGNWEALEPGLELGSFPTGRPAEAGDSTVRVLRIDPALWDLRLLNASAPGQGRLQTARTWCERNGLAAAINASMYQTDYRTSVSLMRTRDHVNNPRLSKDNTVLAFDPLDDSVPPVQIIDRRCQDFDLLRPKYGTLVQSIRMISCDGLNVWRQQSQKWSTAAIGTDAAGNVLFIHARSPYTTHDLTDILLALPLGVKSAMYAEGGAEAQLYVRAGGRQYEFVGRYGSSLVEDVEAVALPIPNVVGVVRRDRPARR